VRPWVDLVGGARPNFMKIAPVARALAAEGRVDFRVVHTGQHYDAAMADAFFAELGIPAPAAHLGVGSGSHGAQTARILERYEARLLAERPAASIVFGDVNSTLACALAAAKLRVPVVHVEAGLRSFDPEMPEELNRRLTDAASDLLFASEESGLTNLRREGIPESKLRLVGNTMIDTLLQELPAARSLRVAAGLGLEPRGFGFVTLHRPSNVDDPTVLGRILELLHELGARLPLVFPVHPRTRAAAAKAGLGARLRGGQERLRCLDPLPYRESLSLLSEAALVLTDSGGVQEETSALRVPCLTLRESTERPVTLELGTSRLVGHDEDRIRAAFESARAGDWPKGQEIPLWDGKAGERIARELATWLCQRDLSC
jgi:UDP-N-acetylglucosamine 2-epimerase (non-hydrolysing)